MRIVESLDRDSGQICSWVSDLFFEPYFWQLSKPVLTLEGVFTAQVLYPGLPMTIEGASGLVIWSGLQWAGVVMDGGSQRENVQGQK